MTTASGRISGWSILGSQSRRRWRKKTAHCRTSSWASCSMCTSVRGGQRVGVQPLAGAIRDAAVQAFQVAREAPGHLLTWTYLYPRNCAMPKVPAKEAMAAFVAAHIGSAAIVFSNGLSRRRASPHKPWSAPSTCTSHHRRGRGQPGAAAVPVGQDAAEQFADGRPRDLPRVQLRQVRRKRELRDAEVSR